MVKGGNKNRNKNVFKVAGARSLKAKNKAKAVSMQLKKLTEMAKQKTQEVDLLLNQLQETVRQSGVPKCENKPVANYNLESRREKIDAFNKTEDTSAQALDKLDKMTV